MASEAISEQLVSTFFWGSMPLDLPRYYMLYMLTLGPNYLQIACYGPVKTDSYHVYSSDVATVLLFSEIWGTDESASKFQKIKTAGKSNSNYVAPLLVAYSNSYNILTLYLEASHG